MRRSRRCAAYLVLVASCTPFGAGDSADAGSLLVDGEAPADSGIVNDGGATDAPAPITKDGDDAAARVPTCFGRPFGALQLVNTSAITATVTDYVWSIKVVAGTAYFGAIPKAPPLSYDQVFKATFTGGELPSLSNAILVTTGTTTSPPHYWSPAVSSDATFMVHQKDEPPRNLALSMATGGGTFGEAVPIASLNTTFDEADPWLAGKPSKALYFARGASTNTTTIFRAPLTLPVTGVGQFGTASKLVLDCPNTTCATAVVNLEESMIIFSAWTGTTDDPQTYEAPLSVVGTTATVGSPIRHHPELGMHFPSWISDDGCEILLAPHVKPPRSDLQYARRTAK